MEQPHPSTACSSTDDQLAKAMAALPVATRDRQHSAPVAALSLADIVTATHAVQLQAAANAAIITPLPNTPTAEELDEMEDREMEAAQELEQAKRRLSIKARELHTLQTHLAEGRRRNKNRRERERAAKRDAIRKKLAAEQLW